MQMNFTTVSPAGSATYVVGATPGTQLVGAAQAADKLTGGAIRRAATAAGFTGKTGEILELLAPAGMPAARLIVAGLGEGARLDAPAAETAAAGVIARILKGADTDVVFEIAPPQGSPMTPADLAAHLALGAYLAAYRFDAYRTRPEEPTAKLKKCSFVTPDAAAAKKAWARLEAVAKGICLARDLTNEPANILSPEEFARRVKALATSGAKSGAKSSLKVEVLGEAQMKKLGMGALLGVGQGSVRESKLVVLQWLGGRKGEAPLAFIGKGLCFDSGGLSLKTGSGMMGMKGDMGGAAAVTGAMMALAGRKAPVNAIGVLALAENMPDGGAQRPDDVVTTMSGQTVEVLNTDAEGRLALADALWYARTRFKPKAMVDLATLTGAMIVALGNEYAGLFSNDDALAAALTAAGTATGEPVWRMPMGPAYDKLLKSRIADMKNVAGRPAGSITAAQFLKRFVGDTPWAHLDIAGVSDQSGTAKPLTPGWATGWGVRILDALAGD